MSRLGILITCFRIPRRAAPEYMSLEELCNVESEHDRNAPNGSDSDASSSSTNKVFPKAVVAYYRPKEKVAQWPVSALLIKKKKQKKH